MIAPLSKYMVVRYNWTGWDIYKSQYLNTVEEARAYIQEARDPDMDDDVFKIFELKEVQ